VLRLKTGSISESKGNLRRLRVGRSEDEIFPAELFKEQAGGHGLFNSHKSMNKY
jgi:hypothetical protein